MLDAVLDEVTAFIELRDMVSGTVLTNNSKHQHLSSKGATQPGQDVEIPGQETRNTVSQEIIGTPRKCKRLLGRTAPTAPPDRGSELENIKLEICRIEKEISNRCKREVETV